MAQAWPACVAAILIGVGLPTGIVLTETPQFGVADGSFDKWMGLGEAGWSYFEKDVDEMWRAGVQWVRMGIRYPGDDATDAQTKARIEMYESRGIQILPYLSVGDTMPDDLDAYKDWVRETVRRYPHLRVWEIQNEPNLIRYWKGTAEDYVRLLQAAYEAIKEIDPEARVMLGGLSEWGAEGFIDQLVELDAWRWSDLFGFHPYGRDPSQVLARLRSAQRRMRGTPFETMPIWITEIGFNTAHHWVDVPGTVADEATKARYLIEVFERLREVNGVEGPIFWYVFQEKGNTMGFGLLNRRLRVIADLVEEEVEYSDAFWAYQELTAKSRREN